MIPSIKEYVKRHVTDHKTNSKFGVPVTFEVVVDKDGREDLVSVGYCSLRIWDVAGRSDYEILHRLVEQELWFTYTCVHKPVPDNVKVYLHMDGKRYLVSEILAAYDKKPAGFKDGVAFDGGTAENCGNSGLQYWRYDGLCKEGRRIRIREVYCTAMTVN